MTNDRRERDETFREQREGDAVSAATAVAKTLRGLGIDLSESFISATMGAEPTVEASVDPDAAQRERRRLRLARLRELGWPERALRVALEPGFDPSRTAIAALRAWDARRSAIVLSGPLGTGKTVAASWCALNARKTTWFATVANMMRVGRFADVWNDWLSAPALCLDDLGAEYADSKGSFVADLDLLVNTFYAGEKPLIVTTNCDGPGIRARYGQRILDRLTECAVWCSVGGVSMRRQ